MAKKSSYVGLRRAHSMNGMRYQKRIEFIAEGLPLILEHAQRLYTDSQAPTISESSSIVLINSAKEEAAKILILMDIIRCPKKRVASNIGKLIKWFYDHLARLIYADIGTMKPQDIPQLKEYTRHYRKSHYLDGAMGEYIFPNMQIYERESRQYVDVAILNSDEPSWFSPLHDGFTPTLSKPFALMICEDIEALGLFTPKGLNIVAELWNTIDFKGEERSQRRSEWTDKTSKRQIGFTETHELMKALYNRVQSEGITVGDDARGAAGRLLDNWQFPMYDCDLSEIIVTQEELEDEQAHLLHQEMGGYQY